MYMTWFTSRTWQMSSNVIYTCLVNLYCALLVNCWLRELTSETAFVTFTVLSSPLSARIILMQPSNRLHESSHNPTNPAKAPSRLQYIVSAVPVGRSSQMLIAVRDAAVAVGFGVCAPPPPQFLSYTSRFPAQYSTRPSHLALLPRRLILFHQTSLFE